MIPPTMGYDRNRPWPPLPPRVHEPGLGWVRWVTPVLNGGFPPHLDDEGKPRKPEGKRR